MYNTWSSSAKSRTCLIQTTSTSVTAFYNCSAGSVPNWRLTNYYPIISESSYEGLMTLDLGVLQTDATSTTISRTVNKDCIFFGVGDAYSNQYVYVNGSLISGEAWWSYGGSAQYIYRFKVTAGSTLQITKVRYCFIS